MSILVIAENSNKEIKFSTLNSVNAASKINDDIHLIVIAVSYTHLTLPTNREV